MSVDLPPVLSIDLTVPEPRCPPRFRLDRLHGAGFASTQYGKYHRILDANGFMEFVLDWPERTTRRAGANFVLRLCSATVNGVSDCPITVSVTNAGVEHRLVTSFDPQIDNWYNRAWYIPGRVLQPGQNRILFRLDGGSTQVWMQRASVALFRNHAQQNTNWCWSTVASNIGAFYRSADPVPQEDVTRTTWEHFSDSMWGKALKRKLGDQDFVASNLPWFAHLALRQYNLLRPRPEDVDAGAQPAVIPADNRDVVWRPLTFEELSREASWMRPVVACIKWKQGGNHFIVLTGVGETEEQMVAVQDPWGGEYHYVKYATLRDNYNGAGRWFYTCLTRPAQSTAIHGETS